MSGLSASGFEIKRFDEIKTELENSFKAVFGPNINVSESEPLGQIIGILAEREALVWELSEGVYNSQYPSTAEGIPLDNVAAITGTTRLSATKSTAEIEITGTPGTIIDAGFTVSVNGSPNDQFVTLQQETIGGGGTVDADVEAVNFGPTLAPAASLTEIDTPVSGVTSVTNSADAIVGRDEESDADLKARRKESLQKGITTIEGIRSFLLQTVDDVNAVFVIENVLDVPDGASRPGHSFETIVDGGVDLEIAQAIFDAKPAGIETFGSESEIITDSQGGNHTIRFSRPTPIDIYIIVNITKNIDPAEGSVYPVDGDTQVENALLAYASENLGIGDDVIVNQLYTPINTVAGVIGIDIKIGTAPAPTLSNNITVDATEISAWDSARITVNS